MNEAHRLLDKPEFPRSSGYDPDWVMANQMGPNALWLVEWLCGAMPLRPGMRVLDLGCGRGLTSIYLAREHGVRVTATRTDADAENLYEPSIGVRFGVDT